VNSNDSTHYRRVAKISFDVRAGEAYVSDGYANRRVAVIDMASGKLKRYWGAYGNKPDDTRLPPYDPSAPPDKQFRTPVHCAEPTTDGLVYVCDRVNDRIQVFRKDGTFVKEQFIARGTLGSGSVWDIAFSTDTAQTYLIVIDGTNQQVYIVDRQTLEVVSGFGHAGHWAGQFYGAHNLATDSSGNLFIGETYEGKRVQKFVHRGSGPTQAPLIR